MQLCVCKSDMPSASRLHTDTAAEPHRWTTEGDDYGQLLVEVPAAVPEGWDLLSVQLER